MEKQSAVRKIKLWVFGSSLIQMKSQAQKIRQIELNNDGLGLVEEVRPINLCDC